MGNIREWLSQVMCFLCLMTVVLHVIPDTKLKKYVRHFLGLLFLLTVLEPLGKLLGGEEFLMNFEAESLKGLYQEYEEGKQGLEAVLPDWDEEEYQRELEEKVQEIYDTYHIPQQEGHKNE
ncbi:MAG: stage III sporulation protein AF [Lachnospiraceae bacterium]|nr:stage III sporulation protein AF [Lachnospiraceae bacterium]